MLPSDKGEGGNVTRDRTDRGGDEGTLVRHRSLGRRPVYPSLSSWSLSLSWSSVSPWSSLSSLSSSSGALCPAISTLGLQLKNLELFHHFTTITYKTVASGSELPELWRLVVPRTAFSYEYVMHELLAVSALHLSFLRPWDESYAMIAAEHHDKALESLKTALPAESPQHATALYAASSLVALYEYACPPAVEGIKAPMWIPLFRGIWLIVRRHWEWVRHGELGRMLSFKLVGPGHYPGEDTEFPSSLYALSQRDAPGQLDPEELEDDEVLQVYCHATETLRVWWDRSWLTEYRVAAAFGWPVNIQDEFVDFIQEERPRALVLLAHHCAQMESIRDHFWWTKGRGADEIERIEGILEDKWKHWLDWPKMRCIPKAREYT